MAAQVPDMGHSHSGVRHALRVSNRDCRDIFGHKLHGSHKARPAQPRRVRPASARGPHRHRVLRRSIPHNAFLRIHVRRKEDPALDSPARKNPRQSRALQMGPHSPCRNRHCGRPALPHPARPHGIDNSRRGGHNNTPSDTRHKREARMHGRQGKRVRPEARGPRGVHIPRTYRRLLLPRRRARRVRPHQGRRYHHNRPRGRRILRALHDHHACRKENLKTIFVS